MKIFNFDVTALHSLAKNDNALVPNHVASVVRIIIDHLQEHICYLLNELKEKDVSVGWDELVDDRKELYDILRFYYNKAKEMGIALHYFGGMEVMDSTDEEDARANWHKVVGEYGLGNCAIEVIQLPDDGRLFRVFAFNFVS